MKVVILCGGYGTRIRDVADDIPKPMIPVGGLPILWHIMKYYAHWQHSEFVLCLGYKAEVIKDFFLNYEAHTRDFTIYDTDDQVRLLRRLYADAGINLKDPAPQTVINAISRHKDHLRSPAQAAAEAKLPHEKSVAELYRRYQDAMVGANAVDFGDLVNLMVEVLERHVPDIAWQADHTAGRD